MNANPQSPQRSERGELSRLLPAPADPDLSRDRHLLLKEHLMNHVQEDSRLTARRRRLTTRFVVPVALAAAVAGVAVSIGQTPGDTDTVTVAAGPDRITNVAYTLDREPHNIVKLSMPIETSGMSVQRVLSDPAGLQHDLDRMGVNARVYRDDPSCPVAQKDLNRDREANKAAVGKIGRENDRLVTTIHRDKIPNGSTLVVVLPPTGGKGHGLFGIDVLKGELPSCYHAQNEELP